MLCRSGQSAFRFALFESAYHGNIVVLLYTPVPWGPVRRSAVCTESCTKFTDSCSARQKSHGTCKQPGMMPYPLDINRTRCKCGKSLPGLFDIVTNFGPIRPQVSSRYIASQSLTVLPEFYRYSILSVYSNPRPPLLVAGPAPRATRHGGRGHGHTAHAARLPHSHSPTPWRPTSATTRTREARKLLLHLLLRCSVLWVSGRGPAPPAYIVHVSYHDTADSVTASAVYPPPRSSACGSACVQTATERRACVARVDQHLSTWPRQRGAVRCSSTWRRSTSARRGARTSARRSRASADGRP